MKNFLLLITLLSFTACGKVQVEVKGDVDVHHKIEVADLNKYFEAECTQENPGYTSQQIQECAGAKIGQVLSFLAGAH